MASAEELRALRAMANRRHRAATRKISRLKSDAGVNVSGTSVDPRRSRNNIKNYTEKQLRSYINQLDKFTSRSNQYVPDAHRRPIPRSQWRQYQRLEQQYNQSVSQRFSSYRDLPGPTGMTIGERMELMTPKFPYMQDRAVNSPYTPINRKSTNVGSARALKRLTAEMRDRVKSGHFDNKISDGREQFDKMSEMLDAPGLANRVRGLSDEQFDVLWNYTGFADAISLGYDINKNLLAGNEKRWHGQVLNTSMSTANELVSWAERVNVG